MNGKRGTGRIAAALVLLALGGCAAPHVEPDFATKPYVPFNREDAVAIARREWRLFGSLNDNQPEAAQKPERTPGLWERVGEYWWLGLGGAGREARWTGMHDENGRVFPPWDDERYAWSAAFISYVMRIAGAGERFPYAPNHAAYLNAAASGTSPILKAHPPQAYAPKPGDLLCFGRDWASGLTPANLPTRGYFPGHCALVVAARSGALDVIGGNDRDAVTIDHLAVASDGSLTSAGGALAWPIVIEVRYDAETDAGPGTPLVNSK